MQSRGGEQLGKVIEERFLRNFSPCCLGVALVSEMPFENGVADESVVSDLRDTHRPALGRRSSGFCDGKAASSKKSLTVSLTVRGNRSA